MIPISNYMQKQTKKIINRNELKGEEQEETVKFFSYCLLLVQLCNPSFPAAMPSEMATMITGRPTHKERKEIETLLPRDNTRFGEPKALLQLPLHV